MARRIFSWLFLLALAAAGTAALSAAARADQAGRRFALVIGNADYTSVEPLKNPVNDANAVADQLRQLGFTVVEARNVGLAAFRKTVSNFSHMVKGADTALFYYSGHGFQMGGVNYLVPVDARLADRAAIAKETLRLDDVIGDIESHDRQTLIFLDACRDNPLPAAVRGDESGGGLAQMDTGNGTFIAFATEPGNVTHDGTGDHSPFTAALLQNISSPGLSIADMMIRVRNSVIDATAGAQTPWDQSSLRSQFYFKPEDETSVALTKEDIALLRSLDPSLRKKFEARFGIHLEDAGAAASGGVEQTTQIASIQIDSGAAPAARDAVRSAGDEAPRPAATTVRQAASSAGADRAVAVEGASSAAAAPKAAESGKATVGHGFLIEAAPPDIGAGNAKTAAAEPRRGGLLIEAAPPAGVEKPEKPAVAPAQPPSAGTASSAAPSPGQVVIDLAPHKAAAAAGEGASAAPASMEASAPSADMKVAMLPPAAGPKPSAALPQLHAAPSAPPAAPPPAAASPQGQASASLPAPSPRPSTLLEPQAQSAVNDSSEAAPESSPSEKPAAGQPASGKPAASAPALSSAATPAAMPQPGSARQATGNSQEENPQKKETQLAALTPAGQPETTLQPQTPKSQGGVGIPQTLTPANQADLAGAIQTELKRLGCYRSDIDGIWGPNSARALLRYYATKKEDPDELEPSNALLARLTDEDSVVCKITILPPQEKRVVRLPKREAPRAAHRSRRASEVAESSGGESSPKAHSAAPAGKRVITKKFSFGGLH